MRMSAAAEHGFSGRSVVEIREQCLEAGVPFFFKQWGGVNKKKAGRLLDGRTWEGLPAALIPQRTAQGFV